MPFASHRWSRCALLAVAVSAAVGLFAVRNTPRTETPTAKSQPTAAREVGPWLTPPLKVDELEKVTFGGKLSHSDYQAIRQIVAKHERLFERNILSIEILGPKQIEVTTGPKDLKPLDGGGNILTIQKQQGNWLVVELGSWVG